MATIYKTVEGDMLDAIIARHYGNVNGLDSKIMEANSGLADHGMVLPANLEILLPDLVPVKPEGTKLWD
ncbi:MAG: tail protein X [Pseudomonadota bacterium]